MCMCVCMCGRVHVCVCVFVCLCAGGWVGGCGRHFSPSQSPQDLTQPPQTHVDGRP